jgi:hypothetical protein
LSSSSSSRRSRTQRGRSAPQPVAEAHRIGVAGDGHDARHDWNRDAGLLAALHEVEVGVGVVEELGQRAVRAGLHLAAEVLEVRAGLGLRMHLGISGHLDLESVAVRLADEADQFAGVVELARRGGLMAVAGRSPRSATMRFTPASR